MKKGSTIIISNQGGSSVAIITMQGGVHLTRRGSRVANESKTGCMGPSNQGASCIVKKGSIYND